MVTKAQFSQGASFNRDAGNRAAGAQVLRTNVKVTSVSRLKAPKKVLRGLACCEIWLRDLAAVRRSPFDPATSGAAGAQ